MLCFPSLCLYLRDEGKVMINPFLILYFPVSLGSIHASAPVVVLMASWWFLQGHIYSFLPLAYFSSTISRHYKRRAKLVYGGGGGGIRSLVLNCIKRHELSRVVAHMYLSSQKVTVFIQFVSQKRSS